MCTAKAVALGKAWKSMRQRRNWCFRLRCSLRRRDSVPIRKQPAACRSQAEPRRLTGNMLSILSIFMCHAVPDLTVRSRLVLIMLLLIGGFEYQISFWTPFTRERPDYGDAALQEGIGGLRLSRQLSANSFDSDKSPGKRMPGTAMLNTVR